MAGQVRAASAPTNGISGVQGPSPSLSRSRYRIRGLSLKWSHEFGLRIEAVVGKEVPQAGKEYVEAIQGLDEVSRVLEGDKTLTSRVCQALMTGNDDSRC